MPSTDTRELEKVVPHIYQEGARYHVLWWTETGRHCTEPLCEINHPPQGQSDEH